MGVSWWGLPGLLRTQSIRGESGEGGCHRAECVALRWEWHPERPVLCDLPSRCLCLPGEQVHLAAPREAAWTGRRRRLWWVHRGLARPNLRSFQKRKEGLSLLLGFVPSGSCPENHYGSLEFLGLVHVQLAQKVKEEKDSQKRPNYQKEEPHCHRRPGLQTPGKQERRTSAGGVGGLLSTPSSH